MKGGKKGGGLRCLNKTERREVVMGKINTIGGSHDDSDDLNRTLYAIRHTSDVNDREGN